MAEGMRVHSANVGPLPQGKIAISMYSDTKGRTDVRRVNLYSKGIVLIHSTKEGHHRWTRAVHTPTGIEGEGPNDQEAFDQLTKKLAEQD